jgi:mono/diheme cytochrome c family protein
MTRYFALGFLAAASMLAVWASRADDAPGTPLYTVEPGNKTDQKTYDGWRTWRALACERCHGPNQEGLVGPSLIDSLKTMTKEQFHTTVMDGRPERGMPPWSASDMMQKNWEGLYAYLKGRSDGKIAPGHVYPIGK